MRRGCRIAGLIACVALGITACSSSSGPHYSMTGSWAGVGQTDSVAMTVTQTGTSVSGTGDVDGLIDNGERVSDQVRECLTDVRRQWEHGHLFRHFQQRDANPRVISGAGRHRDDHLQQTVAANYASSRAPRSTARATAHTCNHTARSHGVNARSFGRLMRTKGGL